MQTTIILIGEDARIWALMQGLKQMGAFEIKYGKLTVDFDGQGKISNVKIEKNYRELSTPIA
jgi:hypothetical protein